MIRRPPRSTLFPTRRSSDLRWRCASEPSTPRPDYSRSTRRRPPKIPLNRCSSGTRGRSEEHTSELQSRLHLVCRLLLEKKKKKKKKKRKTQPKQNNNNCNTK